MPNTFLAKLKENTLLFDGAMGTMLMKAGKGSLKTPIRLNLDEPDLVTDIHRQYYTAGADVVITNTFGGSPLKLVADGLDQQMAELNRAAVKLVRQACPDGKYVAGDIGPSGKMLKPLGDAAPEDVQASFFSQARAINSKGRNASISPSPFSGRKS